MSQTHEEPTDVVAEAPLAVDGELEAGVETVSVEEVEVPDDDDTDADGATAAAVDEDVDTQDSETENEGDEDTSGAAVDGDSDAAEGATAASRRSRRAPSRDLLEKEGEIAADFLETLLDICDLDGDLDVDIDGDRAAVSIVDSDEGRVPRRLVGSDGKVLDALQELTRLAVYSSTGERSRLILDIAGHRAERRSILVAQAQTAIEAVKSSGEKQALEPMSAFERKIVHDEVLAAGLHSESDGVEPRRFVVVLPV